MKGNAYLRNYGSKGKLQNVNDVCDTLIAGMGAGGGNVPLIRVNLKRGYAIDIKEEKEDVDGIDILGNYSKSNYQATSIVNKNGIAPTVRENHGQVTGVVVNMKTKNKRIIKLVDETDFDGKECLFMDIYNQNTIDNMSGTLKSGMDHQQGNIVYNNLRIRKLTPKECWRLMGFDDEDFDKAAKVNSNTQLYKQAGNSIVVNVLEAILKNLLIDNDNTLNNKGVF
jgi:DNA (cytosine-5)-methyltransferase 1